mgnify:CR=1 FL=1
MQTSKQIILDKYIAKPIGICLNVFVRLLGKILRIDHDLNKEFQTIAVCKFKGMGSILQSTPMVTSLREKFPNAEIIYVSVKGNEGILKKIPEIDTIVTVDDSTLWRFAVSNVKALAKLIKIRPDVYFDLEIYSNYSTLFTTFSLAKNRVGYYLRSSSFRMGIYTHMMFYNPRVPIAQAYLQLSKLLACEGDKNDLVNLKSAPINGQKKTLVVNVNASDLRLERRWSKNQFINFIKMFRLSHPDYEVNLIGGKQERAYTEEIEKSIADEKVVSSAGKTSLDELIDIISSANIMLTNDTGPMHIAFCTKTPVVCLFGPCSPDQYGDHPMAQILYHQV